MGFKKEVDINNTGFIANYVNIEVFQYNKASNNGKEFTARCAVFKDEESMREGARAITHFEIVFNDDELRDFLLSRAYGKISEFPELKDSENV